VNVAEVSSDVPVALSVTPVGVMLKSKKSHYLLPSIGMEVGSPNDKRNGSQNLAVYVPRHVREVVSLLWISDHLPSQSPSRLDCDT
jgi:hypothetical protein